MTSSHLRTDAANDEHMPPPDRDAIVSRLGTLIYALLIGLASVAVTVYRYFAPMNRMQSF